MARARIDRTTGAPRLSHLWLAVAVLALAGGLRLWRIADLPPGLHHDEAFHLLQAHEIARGQAFPVYITGNQGNEPLFAYSAAAAMLGLGPVNWAGRLAASWFGLLSIALTMRAAHEMFPRRATWLWAGLLLALLYWHLGMSRWGSQPILSAAAAAGTLALLWRGARTGQWQAFALAGLSLSLGLWAYVAFRLFVFVPLIAVLALSAAWRERRAKILAGGVLAAGVAALVYAPLGLFFLRHPEWFFNRAQQIAASELGGGSELGGAASRLLSNASLVLQGLLVPGRGDQDWRQNLPGRPALDAIQAAWIAGAGLAGLASWPAWRGWLRPQAATLLAWLAFGLLPAVVTSDPPQFGRTAMATPALALIVAVAFDSLWRRARSVPALRWALAGSLAVSGSLTVSDYFFRWAGDENLHNAFDSGLYWIECNCETCQPRRAC